MKKMIFILVIFSLILFGCKIKVPDLPEANTSTQSNVLVCTDTDNGSDPKTEGMIHVFYPDGNELELTDFCKYADPLNEPDKIVEYFCDESSNIGYNLTEINCDCHDSQTGISVGYCRGENYIGLTI